MASLTLFKNRFGKHVIINLDNVTAVVEDENKGSNVRLSDGSEIYLTEPVMELFKSLEGFNG